jgi:hypothetical protein
MTGTHRTDYTYLAGYAFPGGTVVVPYWMNWLWADSVSAQDPSPYVHPVLVYYAAVQGSNITFEEIFELMDAAADSGVVAGEQSLEFSRPIEIDREYEVAGGITAVIRKRGRRAGVFDMLTFELSLQELDASGPAAISTMTFIFPRTEVVAG